MTMTLTFHRGLRTFTRASTPSPTGRFSLATLSIRLMLSCGVVALSIVGSAAHAQGAPEAAPANGQVFEEEIVPQRFENDPQVSAFIDDLVARYDFDPAVLHKIFNQVSYSASAVKLVTPSPTPSTKNWSAYQHRFLEPIRINGGVKFWQANRQWLDKAAAQYGVPQEIIVAIIGVETLY